MLTGKINSIFTDINITLTGKAVNVNYKNAELHFSAEIRYEGGDMEIIGQNESRKSTFPYRLRGGGTWNYLSLRIFQEMKGEIV